jgi:hypothetical protein
MTLLKNKKGNIYGVVLMAILLFMVGMLVANFLKTPIDNTRIDLDCSNTAGITDGTKIMCLVTDFTMIYWITLVLSIAGGAILDKFVI